MGATCKQTFEVTTPKNEIGTCDYPDKDCGLVDDKCPPVVPVNCEGKYGECDAATCKQTFEVTTPKNETGTCNYPDKDCGLVDDKCPEIKSEPSMYMPAGVTQWCLAVGVTLAVVTVVPYALFKCYQYLFPAKEAEPIKQVEPVVQKPVVKPAAPVTAPAKTTEEPVVEPKSYGNMIIIALIVACVIGMLISVYFVCIKKDEQDIDIEDPEAP